MFQTIKSFQEVPLLSQTLYVLDFDDTIIYFDNIDKNWWINKYNHYCNQYGDHNHADQKALSDWVHSVSSMEPKHVDETGFKALIMHCNDNNSHAIILTARDNALSDITKSHLNTVSPNTDIDIIFCSGTHKGHKLQTYLDKVGIMFEHIIFVDDNKNNLIDFKTVHTNSRCYHMSDSYKI